MSTPSAASATPLTTTSALQYLDSAMASLSDMARLEIDLYGAALRYAQDTSGGQLDPRRLSLYHDVRPQTVPAEQAARVLAWSPYAAEYVTSLHPVYLPTGSLRGPRQMSAHERLRPQYRLGVQ
jgi:murein L,D-transpeptidase YcbB/YkuD